MAMHNRLNIGSRPVDFAVDETLEKTSSAVCVECIAVEIIFENVVRSNQRRRERARHEVPVRRRRLAHRHVTERVDDTLCREDSAGCCEIRVVHAACSSHAIICRWSTNPGCCRTTWPFFVITKLGMLITLNRWASAGHRSVSTFSTIARPDI